MIKNVLSSLLVVGVLAACGGGGGGGGTSAAVATVASTLPFPLQQALRNMNAYGNSANYEAHGTYATEAADGLCAGTMYSTNSAATTSTLFEGAFAFSSTDSTTVSYTNCTPSPTTSGGTDYFDGNYDQVGYIDSSSYRVYGPWTVPATVHVGDAGFLVTEMAYTNSSKTAVQFRRDISYSVAADTASTAIVNIMVRYYFPDYIDSAGIHPVYTQFSTVQSRNRITASGSLVELSTDTQRLNVNSTAGSSVQHHYVWNMVSNTPGTIASTPSTLSGATNFAYTGAVQTVTVPGGATTVTVSASGGGGGGGTYTTGGAGGSVSASWNLAALGSPASLSLYVGGAGAVSGSINSGEGSSGAGGGGGATVVAFGSNQALLIVGGGGGGGAGTDTTAAGGNGCGGNGGGAHGYPALGGSGGGSTGTGGAGGSVSGLGGGGGGSSNGSLGAVGVGGGGGGGGGSNALGGGAGGTNNGVTGSGGGGGFGAVAGSNPLMTLGGYGGGGAANYGGGGGGGYGGGGAGSYLGYPAYGGGGGGGSTYIRTPISVISCASATTGAGVGGLPHAYGQNGGVSITFN